MVSHTQYEKAKANVKEYEQHTASTKSKKKTANHNHNAEGLRVDKDGNVIVSAMSRLHIEIDHIRAIMHMILVNTEHSRSQALNELSSLDASSTAYALKIKNTNIEETLVANMNPVQKIEYDMRKEGERSTRRIEGMNKWLSDMKKIVADGGSLLDMKISTADTGCSLTKHDDTDSDSGDEQAV